MSCTLQDENSITLEEFSSGMLEIERLENQINKKSLGARKPKGQRKPMPKGDKLCVEKTRGSQEPVSFTWLLKEPIGPM